ncbi:MAG: IS66 family transposase [Candidatus Levybacteria bacterium]|nr:IS66 family transposase [Candidatus Levybacteria bacterium]
MLNPAEIYVLRRENQYLKVHNTRLKEWHLIQKDKADKLEKENSTLKKENRKLKDQVKKVQEELEKIRKQRDTYKGMIFKAKLQQTEKATGVKRQLGGQLGHLGVSRNVPVKIDQKVRVFLKSCPNCHNLLKRSDSSKTHTIEDIPNLEQIRTQVTEYRIERQWCNYCHKEVVGKPTMAIPHSRLGLNLIIQILIFKYVCRMSLEVLVETLSQTYGVTISQGGIINILRRTKTHLGKDYGKLLKAIRSSPVKHADETGWRIAGLNGFLWAFLTKAEVYYTIEETRGGGVAKAALEDSSKDDVLVRDDYAGYKNLKMNHQSCWAHLLRKSREEASQPKSSKEVNNLHLTLKNMYQGLLEITNQPFNQDLRQKDYQDYSLKLQQLKGMGFRAKDARRVQTRIQNQGTNLITALLHDGVPLTNNAAERQIRPAVVVRKISGGSRSTQGAETFATNFSVIQTIKVRNQPLIPTLKELILQGAAGKN